MFSSNRSTQLVSSALLIFLAPLLMGAERSDNNSEHRFVTATPEMAPSVRGSANTVPILPPPLPIIASAVPATANAPAVVGKPLKQAVFLICPFKSGYSAWSVYLTVDSNDPSKVISLGLETLKDQNAKDKAYEEVQKAQINENTPRTLLAELPSKDFGHREIGVVENDALHLSLTPTSDGAYDLMISMRVGMSDRFVIGGKEKNKMAVTIRYNKVAKVWAAFATTLIDTDNENHGHSNASLSGIVFPVSLTGIYRVFAVLESGETALLMDR